jgi:glucose-1-phosphate thymidylyltransferase
MLPITVVDDGTSTNETRLGAVMDIQYAVEKLGIGEDVLVLAGDNVLDFSLVPFVRFGQENGCSCIMWYEENDRAKQQRTAIITVNAESTITSYEEKPKEPKSNICVTGLYFYPAGVAEVARNVKPSARGELEITSVNQAYLEMGKLRLENLGLGFAWLDTGTFDSLSEASNYVETIEKRTGQQIACLEEIAYNNHWIDKVTLLTSANEMIKNEYGKYLIEIAERPSDKILN